jgi:hypothetical protein
MIPFKTLKPGMILFEDERINKKDMQESLTLLHELRYKTIKLRKRHIRLSTRRRSAGLKLADPDLSFGSRSVELWKAQRQGRTCLSARPFRRFVDFQRSGL